MLDALNITEAEAAGLSELASLDLAMARDFAARARAEKDPDTANELARSYQRMARSYRQTLALKARLQREIAQSARLAEEARREAEPHARRIAQRKAQVRDHAERTIALEVENLDDDVLLETRDLASVRAALEARLEAWSAQPHFLDQPVDLIAVHVLQELEPVIDAVFRQAAVRSRPPAEPPPRESG